MVYQSSLKKYSQTTGFTGKSTVHTQLIHIALPKSLFSVDTLCVPVDLVPIQEWVIPVKNSLVQIPILCPLVAQRLVTALFLGLYREVFHVTY